MPLSRIARFLLISMVALIALIVPWYHLSPYLAKPVIAAANAAINAALKEKSVIDSLAIVGLMPHGSTPEEQARWQKAEYDTWGPLIKKIGFTADS